MLPKISTGSFRNTHRALWESVQAQFKRLWFLQNMLLAEFPEYYKQLPDSLEHCLQLRSLFAFVEELWVILAKKYKTLCQALEKSNEQIPDSIHDLESLLKEILAMPLEIFVQRTEGGLLQLEDLVKQFSEKLASGIFDTSLSESYPKDATIGWSLEMDAIEQKLSAIRQRKKL